MSAVDFEVERVASDAQVWRLAVKGELDAATAPRLSEVLEFALAQGAHFAVLHCDDLSFCDSSGLRTLVHAQSRFEARGGRLLLEGLSGAAERVLELTGLLETLAGRG
jgi:anti-sigma B factor antagonist